jgi:hypothetical protein
MPALAARLAKRRFLRILRCSYSQLWTVLMSVSLHMDKLGLERLTLSLDLLTRWMVLSLGRSMRCLRLNKRWRRMVITKLSLSATW